MIRSSEKTISEGQTYWKKIGTDQTYWNINLPCSYLLRQKSAMLRPIETFLSGDQT